MGKLIWHEYARLVSISASVYAIWASIWGILFRKFFWDFIGGTLRDPGGLQPSPKVAIFIAVIIKIPLIQITTIVSALSILALEYPLPLLRNLAIYRSFVCRIVLLLALAFFTALFYQGTNAALWSLIAIGCYVRALVLGETMAEAKNNTGKVGSV